MIKFQLWDKSIKLCSEFVNSTNIITLNSNNDLTPFIGSVLIKEIQQFEIYCDKLKLKLKHTLQDYIKESLKRIVTSNYSKYYIRCILEFLSSCYNERKISKKFDFMYYLQLMINVEDIICLQCFFSLIRILSIDTRMICIPEYIDEYGLLIKSKSYKQILHQYISDCNETLTIKVGYYFIYLRIRIKYILIEINNQLDNIHIFIRKLQHYTELKYFNKNNPRIGVFTPLRFL